ncbi:hypothetical protein DP939_06595 [Spongiactinospora rosea]|uniref:DUF2306 domain-containing protein n=1 Tax=Spongiactinospora rosea TaxID=2248750 RepID=A0A366M4J0_9ACTN|nr:DUF2306 domain-containing protein [Spongiactinospora rosea]RBQ20743.1 hypothetical protein DP939_06595 [Spongiactinospora rosea]
MKIHGYAPAAGLVLLVLVPVIAGGARLAGARGGAEIPVPLAVHIVAATGYGLVGAFQFAPRFRRHRPGWHRAAGRVLVGLGLASALSGVWLTLPPAGEGPLVAFRLVFGSAMAGCLVLGLAAARRRDIGRHRAWMIRAYAIGAAAGTQAFTQAAWIAAYGPPGALTRELLVGAGWVINVAVAEWIIRRRSARRHAVGLVRPHGDLDPVADAELGHQAGDVALHRAQ